MPSHDDEHRSGIQCAVTILHFVTTASLICPVSCAQAISSTFTEISFPMKFFSCAACAQDADQMSEAVVTKWSVVTKH